MFQVGNYSPQLIKPTIYLDTSVINFLFADDAPEKKEITIDFFDNFVKMGIYETSISEYVIDEIQQDPNEKEKERLLKVVEDYQIFIHPVSDMKEIAELARHYLTTGVIPTRKLFDALHVAFCTIRKIDYLVSWNFKHLANINRERRIILSNLTIGYIHPLRIITPSELTGYGN